MSRRSPLLDLALAAAISAALTTGPGCAPRVDAQSPPSATAQKSPLEVECERDLRHLDGLIEARRRDHRVSAATLSEAIALRRSALELILEESYDLALDLIDEAVELLEPGG